MAVCDGQLPVLSWRMRLKPVHTLLIARGPNVMELSGVDADVQIC